MTEHDLHQLLGAYLLGGLDTADTERFEAHLLECDECRSELDDFRSLPGLLDSLPVPDAVALTSPRPADFAREAASLAVPPAVLAGLATRRRKTRRRWAALVGAVGAACLAIGFSAGPLLDEPPKPDATYSVEASSGLHITLGLLKKNWGTELAVEGRSLPENGTFSLWVMDRDGGEDRACAWSATPSGRVRLTGATPVQLTSISSVELRNERQQAVAVISVLGGSP